jgi:hypothetical protein
MGGLLAHFPCCVGFLSSPLNNFDKCDSGRGECVKIEARGKNLGLMLMTAKDKFAVLSRQVYAYA